MEKLVRHMVGSSPSLDPIRVAVGEMNPCAGSIQELELLVLQTQRLISESDVPSRIDESVPPQDAIVRVSRDHPTGDPLDTGLTVTRPDAGSKYRQFM